MNDNTISLKRLLLKTAILFVVLNGLFTLVSLDWLGGVSLYNGLVPGRERLPYGENPADSYNLSLNNLPAMLNSHTISQPKADNEYRILLIGDSGVWGWFLDNPHTLAGQLNSRHLQTSDGQNITFYNLGYPIMSLTKDLLILDAGLAHDPDLIIWLVTLESFPFDKQLLPPLVQHNPHRLQPHFATTHLSASDFTTPTIWERTIVGQRRPLADLFRLQFYGISWGATHIDQAIPTEFTPRQSNFETDISWQTYSEPTTLTQADLAFDILAAGINSANNTPIWVVNEPIFISDGENSDLHYNAWYPRWAYDEYRHLLSETADTNNWLYFDLWDTIDPLEFTDSPVHLSPAGNHTLADQIQQHLCKTIC